MDSPSPRMPTHPVVNFVEANASGSDVVGAGMPPDGGERFRVGDPICRPAREEDEAR